MVEFCASMVLLVGLACFGLFCCGAQEELEGLFVGVVALAGFLVLVLRARGFGGGPHQLIVLAGAFGGRGAVGFLGIAITVGAFLLIILGASLVRDDA